ncbi:MAG: hypothetical protein GVY36_03380 [Verrucomicrobia bacterium]|nr:hypothetical protein [Verrucomicrobiota bacterium]
MDETQPEGSRFPVALNFPPATSPPAARGESLSEAAPGAALRGIACMGLAFGVIGVIGVSRRSDEVSDRNKHPFRPIQ